MFFATIWGLLNTNCGVAEKEDLELDPLQLAF
jgi:hypothetical protein